MNLIVASQQQPGGADLMSLIIPFIFIYGIMYFLMIRPQRLKAKQHAEKVNALKKGAKVILDSGIHGEIEAIEESTFNIKIADKVVIKVEQGGIRAILGEEGSVKPEEAKA